MSNFSLPVNNDWPQQDKDTTEVNRLMEKPDLEELGLRELHAARPSRGEIESEIGMQSLPAETIAHIFALVCYLPAPPHNVRRPEPDSLRPVISALGLTRVSRRWRDIALSTPTVWSQIAIGPRTSPERLSLLFERSKAHALDLMIDVRDGALLPKLLATCEGVASRCQALTIQFTDPYLFSSLFDALASPRLERISVWPYGMFASSWPHELPGEKAPSITSIYANGPINIESINSERLTTLDMFCTGDEVFQIMETCTNLEAAFFHIEGEVSMHAPSQILAPRISELHLAFWDDHHWAGLMKLLQCLSAPILTSLGIAPFIHHSETLPLASLLSATDANIPFDMANVRSVTFDFEQDYRVNPSAEDGYMSGMIHIASKLSGVQSLGIRLVSINSLRLALLAKPLAMPLVHTLTLHQFERNRGKDWTTPESSDDIAAILDLRRGNDSVADFTTLVLDGDSPSNAEEIRVRAQGKACRVVSVNTRLFN